MSKTAFFVQNNYVEALTIPVAQYARQHFIALEDRSSHKYFDADKCGIDWSCYDVVLPYGSVQFIRQLKSSSLDRFILHDERMFATSTWSTHFGRDALNGLGALTLAHAIEELLNSGPLHLRPDSVDKAFVGGVFDKESWRQLRGERALPYDLACWASPPVTINAEWRCWIINGMVVEVSRYRSLGAMSLHRESDRHIFAVAQSFADVYVPSPCVVLDIALVGDNFKVVEFNPIHCSGWYKADVGNVLDQWVRWANSNFPNQRKLDEIYERK